MHIVDIGLALTILSSYTNEFNNVFNIKNYNIIQY